MLGPSTRGACIALLLALAALGCSKKDASQAPAGADLRPRSVYTVNYPLAYFAERLAPEGIEVVFPAPPQVDPAFWTPSADEIGRYQHAELILLNGAGYAGWARYATLPKSKVIVTAAGCRDAFLDSGEAVSHQHGLDGDHAHAGSAFTTWLDIRLARCQADHLADALLELAPAEKGSIDSKRVALDDDLKRIDGLLRDAAKGWGERPLLASHPVYQYLADAYGLRIESMHLEPELALTPDDIASLDSLLARHAATLMLWEAPPLSGTEQQLRERGIVSVVFNPAAQRPSDGDFLTVMTGNAKRLACATGAEPCR